MFKEIYKKNINLQDRQEERRLHLLKEQKEQRLQLHDNQRNVVIEERKVKRKKHTFQEVYGNEISLQLSEWMREKPNNLDDWLLVPCPRGTRCLVTASGGRTRMYSKTGRFRCEFRSRLPSGEPGNRQRGQCTILDCIYYTASNTFYILDAISLSRIKLLHCEAQFRFFWLRSHFDDIKDDLQEITDINCKRFQLLKSYDLANEEQSAVILQRYPIWPDNKPPLDGFLFYHKEASYTCGTTPLVCWLFSFMIPDILHMTVSNEYIKPDDYSTPLIYMDEFDKNLSRKHRKKHKNNIPEPMEMSEEKDDDDDEEEEEDDCSSLRQVLEAERNLEMEGELEDVNC